jgi:hypothetical protein
MHSEHILSLNSPKNFGTLKGIFFCKIYYNVVSVVGIIKFSTSGIVHFGQLREINYLSIGANREKIIRVGFL